MTPPDNSAEARAKALLEKGLSAWEHHREVLNVKPAMKDGFMQAWASDLLTFSAEQNTGGMPGRSVVLKTTPQHRAEAIRKLERLREAFDAYHAVVGTKGARTAKAAWNNAQQVAEVHAIALLRLLIEDVETLSNALSATAGTSAREGWQAGFDEGVSRAGEAQANLVVMAERERERRKSAEEAFDLIAPFVAKFAEAAPFYDGGRPHYPGSTFVYDADPSYDRALTSTATGIGGPGAPVSPTLGDLRMLADAFAAAIKVRALPTTPTAPADHQVQSDNNGKESGNADPA